MGRGGVWTCTHENPADSYESSRGGVGHWSRWTLRPRRVPSSIVTPVIVASGRAEPGPAVCGAGEQPVKPPGGRLGAGLLEVLLERGVGVVDGALGRGVACG